MENLLRKIAESGLENPAWYDLLDALVANEITLPDLLRAKNEDRLHEIRRELSEPLLENAIAEYRVTGLNYDTENGLRVLGEMVEREFGLNARLTVLRSGKNITKLCARAKREGGRNNGPMAHNSVRRTILLSASKLLRFHVGIAVVSCIDGKSRSAQTSPQHRQHRPAILPSLQPPSALARCLPAPS